MRTIINFCVIAVGVVDLEINDGFLHQQQATDTIQILRSRRYRYLQRPEPISRRYRYLRDFLEKNLRDTGIPENASNV